MRKPDKEVWNRRTLLAVLVQCMVMLNVDIYGSSYTLWMSLHGLESKIIFVSTVVTVTSLIGYWLVGVVVDLYGTKLVQMVSLLFLLFAGIGVALSDGMLAAWFLVVRFFFCGVMIISNEIQVRGLLPDEKKDTGLGQLDTIAYIVAVVSVSVGSMLASDHLIVWKWIGPAGTIIALCALILSEQSNQLPEKSKLWHKGVLWLTFPVIGIAVSSNVLVTYIVLDLGVKNGSIVRTMTYIGAALAGWVLSMLFKWHIRKKTFIRMGSLSMAASLMLLLWDNLLALIVASLVIGVVYHGTFNQILGAKAFQMTEQKGLAASTSFLIYGLGGIIGVNSFGLVRAYWGASAMYMSLAGLMLISQLLFEWTFRTSSAWKIDG